MSDTLEMTLGPSRTEDQAREIDAQGKEAVIVALLTLAKQLAQQSATAGSSHQTPATLSGMKPDWCQCGTVWPKCLSRSTKELIDPLKGFAFPTIRETLANALATYLQTGQLPPLQDPTSANE